MQIDLQLEPLDGGPVTVGHVQAESVDAALSAASAADQFEGYRPLAASECPGDENCLVAS